MIVKRRNIHAGLSRHLSTNEQRKPTRPQNRRMFALWRDDGHIALDMPANVPGYVTYVTPGDYII